MIKREPQKKSSIPYQLEKLRWDLAFCKDPEKKIELERQIQDYELNTEEHQRIAENIRKS